MAAAVLLKSGRAAFAKLLRLADETSTPVDVSGLWQCEIGDGDHADFVDPENPPAVDPDDTAIKGTQLGIKTTPTSAEYLVAAPGTGAILYDGQEYDVSVPATDLLLLTWAFGTGDANGEWREVMFHTRDDAVFKIHPVGASGAWQSKDGSQTRDVRLLIQF